MEVVEFGKRYNYQHPLIQHKLTLLRDKNTGSKEFRALVSEIAMLMCYEATRDLPLKEVEIETPVSVAKTRVISGKSSLCPNSARRAWHGDGVLALVPSARVGHIGLYRDPDTLQPVEYYCKLPADIEEREVIVLDPMLATGALQSMQSARSRNAAPKSIKFMGIIAAPEGLTRYARPIQILIFSARRLMKNSTTMDISSPASAMRAIVFSVQNNPR